MFGGNSMAALEWFGHEQLCIVMRRLKTERSPQHVLARSMQAKCLFATRIYVSWLESSLCPTSSCNWLTSDASSWQAILISMFLATSALYCCSSCCRALPSACWLNFLCLLMLSCCSDSLCTSCSSLHQSPEEWQTHCSRDPLAIG